MSNFSEFNLKPYILAALKDIGFSTPTPVQEKLIPKIMQGRDVVGQSATGSGKTHAFFYCQSLISLIRMSTKFKPLLPPQVEN